MSEREVDVLVIGAGMGGMSAALFAAIEGLDVLLCDSVDRISRYARLIVIILFYFDLI